MVFFGVWKNCSKHIYSRGSLRVRALAYKYVFVKYGLAFCQPGPLTDQFFTFSVLFMYFIIILFDPIEKEWKN